MLKFSPWVKGIASGSLVSEKSRKIQNFLEIAALKSRMNVRHDYKLRNNWWNSPFKIKLSKSNLLNFVKSPSF